MIITLIQFIAIVLLQLLYSIILSIRVSKLTKRFENMITLANDNVNISNENDSRAMKFFQAIENHFGYKMQGDDFNGYSILPQATKVETKKKSNAGRPKGSKTKNSKAK